MRLDKKIGAAEELSLAFREYDLNNLDSVLLKVFECKILDNFDELKSWATGLRRTVGIAKEQLINHSLMEEPIPEGFNPLD